MKLIKIAVTALILFAFTTVNAQDELMKELDSVPKEKEVAINRINKVSFFVIIMNNSILQI
jgi:hypothetical protein